MLKKMAKPDSSELLKLYKKSFKMTDKLIEDMKVRNESNMEELSETLEFIRVLLTNYTALKKQAFGMIQIKNNQIEF